MTITSQRINALVPLLGVRRYLEIGVSTGDTFRAVEAAERIGVDPAFMFDIGGLAAETTRLVPQTSDMFFAAEPLESLYDLVLIDGLHTFEQVMRDFTNAILHTHRRSAILIDDVFPNDAYSALPDEAATQRHRGGAGIQDAAWHGDVYKLVFAIHDFWPGLNYRTIMGAGNPQTLVWRARSGRRKPFFDNVEFISRLSYFDMLDCFSLMQPASEADAINLCLQEITSG
jgi:hypothetical protein